MAPAHDAFSPPVTSELVQKFPRDRDGGRESESYRDRGREREFSRDRDRDRESSRDRGREREFSRDRDRDRGSSRDRGRGRESSRDRGREREISRDVDRDRRIGIQTPGDRREEIRQSSGDRSRRYNDNDAADLRKQDAYDEQRSIGRDRGRGYGEDDQRPVGRDRGRGYDEDDQRPVGRDRGRGYDEDDQRPVSRDRGRGYYEDDQRSMGKDRGRDYEDDERRPMRTDRGREFDEERRWMSRDGGRAYEDDERRPMGGGRGRGRGWEGRGRGDSNNDKPAAPPLYSILKATVHSIRPFGIFVKMEGYRNHGLVHLSQVSDHEVTNRDDSEEAKVKALSSIASEGEQVWVKVISVNVEENGNTKTGCSMKYVRQGDGEDLDPNNIQAEKQQSRPAWKEPQKFKLEAVLNVQCQRCGGHGHLKKECYSSGEKTYKLLSDDEDADLTVQNRIKIEDGLPRENSKHMQPPKPVIGISNQLLARGSVGRGRAVVQPAWMKHGIGVGGPAPTEDDPKLKQDSDLPGKLENVGDALAVIAMLKEEKHRRKEERHKKKEKRHKERDEKHKLKKEERRKSRDEKEKHKKRKHRDEKGRKARHSSHKKRRDESSS